MFGALASIASVKVNARSKSHFEVRKAKNGHLIARYASSSPVDRFVKLCSHAGFQIRIQAEEKGVLVDYADSGARQVHDFLSRAPIEVGPIPLADQFR